MLLLQSDRNRWGEARSFSMKVSVYLNTTQLRREAMAVQSLVIASVEKLDTCVTDSYSGHCTLEKGPSPIPTAEPESVSN